MFGFQGLVRNFVMFDPLFEVLYRIPWFPPCVVRHGQLDRFYILVNCSWVIADAFDKDKMTAGLEDWGQLFDDPLPPFPSGVGGVINSNPPENIVVVLFLQPRNQILAGPHRNALAEFGPFSVLRVEKAWGRFSSQQFSPSLPSVEDLGGSRVEELEVVLDLVGDVCLPSRGQPDHHKNEFVSVRREHIPLVVRGGIIVRLRGVDLRLRPDRVGLVAREAHHR
mmetsp:Transcript_19776/g.38307  ORF Transcript_19776/g.38307 Transcript_19776/m.38307 type:complete len:223 (+) Transcript_19776:1265-1933(+)